MFRFRLRSFKTLASNPLFAFPVLTHRTLLDMSHIHYLFLPFYCSMTPRQIALNGPLPTLVLLPTLCQDWTTAGGMAEWVSIFWEGGNVIRSRGMMMMRQKKGYRHSPASPEEGRLSRFHSAGWRAEDY